MPHPYWAYFVVSIALIALLEWEEIASGHARTKLGRIEWTALPIVYCAIAAGIFIVSPLAYARQIETAVTTACAPHGGANDGTVSLAYAGHRYRSGRLHGGPPNDTLTFVCADGAALSAQLVGGTFVSR